MVDRTVDWSTDVHSGYMGEVRLVDRTVDWSTDVTVGTWGRLDWWIGLWTGVQM